MFKNIITLVLICSTCYSCKTYNSFYEADYSVTVNTLRYTKQYFGIDKTLIQFSARKTIDENITEVYFLEYHKDSNQFTALSKKMVFKNNEITNWYPVTKITSDSNYYSFSHKIDISNKDSIEFKEITKLEKEILIEFDLLMNNANLQSSETPSMIIGLIKD